MYWVQVILIVTVLLFQHQSHLCLLEADGGVAHGGLEEDEGVTVDEDGGRRVEIDGRLYGALDAELGDA
jgi:hypothetical protein